MFILTLSEYLRTYFHLRSKKNYFCHLRNFLACARPIIKVVVDSEYILSDAYVKIEKY